VPSIEIKTLATRWPWALGHPEWALAYARDGVVGLYRVLVEQSVEAVRTASPPQSLQEALARKPLSPLGRMGGTQEYLYHVVRWLRPAISVETGVFRGISTAFLLAGLRDNGNGRLYSIDLPNQSDRTPEGPMVASALPPGAETGFAVPSALRERWTLELGDTHQHLPPLLDRVGPIDLFFHDSGHSYENMRWEYGVALAHLRAGGVLASDDVAWNSAFSEMIRERSPAWSTVLSAKLGIALLR
jgi:predicted O-methyltransferase YrrM